MNSEHNAIINMDIKIKVLRKQNNMLRNGILMAIEYLDGAPKSTYAISLLEALLRIKHETNEEINKKKIDSATAKIEDSNHDNMERGET